MEKKPEPGMSDHPQVPATVDLNKLFDSARQAQEQFLQERRSQLEAAKQSVQGTKEAFDIGLLGELYDLRDDHGATDLSPARVEALEMQYYLDFPETKTLEEFAARRAERDAHSVG